MLAKLKQRAAALKRDVFALSIAARDPRTPWYARVFMGLVLAYAFSPIDLIPDFIPVLGYFDDLVIVPLGIALSIKMIPAQVLADSRQKAGELLRSAKPINLWGALIVVGIWVVVLAALVWAVAHVFRS